MSFFAGGIALEDIDVHGALDCAAEENIEKVLTRIDLLAKDLRSALKLRRALPPSQRKKLWSTYDERGWEDVKDLGLKMVEVSSQMVRMLKEEQNTKAKAGGGDAVREKEQAAEKDESLPAQNTQP